MNRAILIVICDFLVSAMLTMMTGMVPAHTGGTGVGLDETTTKMMLSELSKQKNELEQLRAKLRETMFRLGKNPAQEAELRELTRKLAENIASQKKLQASLAATPDNTGELSAKELQTRLDKEQQKLIALEIELRDKQKDLKFNQEKLSRTTESLLEHKRDLAAERRELGRTRDVLAKTSEALVDITKEHTRTKADLARTETKLESAESDIRKRNLEISSAKDELRRINASLSRSQSENTALQTKVANLGGQLNIRERDHAANQDKIERLERQLAQEILEKSEARLERDSMQKTLKSAVAELSAAQSELKQKTQENIRFSAKLEATEKILKDSNLGKNEVFKSYAAAVVKLEVAVTEKSLFGGRTGKSSGYFPVVNFKGKPLIIGTFNRFAGDEKTALSFNEITAVNYSAGSPGGGVSIPLAGNMLVNRSDLQLAAFPYVSKNCTPLKLLTVEALKKRGLENLYLFKSTSFGGSSASLNGRVSMALDSGKNTLFIRNAGRANNELSAEPGDLILSREGYFVGIVTSKDEVDKVRGGRAALFTGENAWDLVLSVPLTKAPGEVFFNRFGESVRKIRASLLPEYRRR